MCGLAGLARIGAPSLEEGGQVLQTMAQTLSHRGPDNTCFLLRDGDPVGLAFNRLSIVDPVGGDQPLLSDDGDIALIANGEIYNHHELEAGLPAGTRMRTHSDCEVLIHLYRRDGVRFLDAVRGIYAVVIWDRGSGRLVLARDRFGIKPLYFHRDRERIVVGSEIKALFADPRTPRHLEWRSCLVDQLMTAAPLLDDRPVTTWFDGIESVPAGAILQFDVRTGRCEEHRYWSLPRPGAEPPCAPDELTRTYRDLLCASVRESGMSDADIGLFLSGGIDSAAVAAFSTGLSSLHTFTALNAGTLANGDGRYAHRVAAALGLPNHQVVFAPDQVPTREEWRRLVWLLETPLCGPEQFYKYELHRFARQTRPNLKVMLLGQASDEFNGGYSAELAGGGDWGDFTANLRAMARQRMLLERPRLAPWWQHEVPLLTDDALSYVSEMAIDDPYVAYVTHKYRDIQQYNCWHEDRTAAGNGTEARVPFLDHRIVELTARIPVADRARLLWDKRLIRDALVGVLPEEFLERPKVGFFYGSGAAGVYRTFGRMLSQDGEALLDEALAGPNAGRFVDRDAVRATLRMIEERRPNASVEFLLRLVNIGLLEQMLVDLPGPVSAWRPSPLPSELDVTDWDAERERIEAAVLQRTPLTADMVPALSDGVMLVRGEPYTGTYYVVVDGSVEYVVDEAEEGDWLRFLLAMDGELTLGDILVHTGCELDGVGAILSEALEAGVVVAGTRQRVEVSPP
jgi:asparagine synthase (glutamine-hydrolysing)